MRRIKPSALIIFLLALVFLGCSGEKNKVCFKDNCFYVELATEPDSWNRGLMFRNNLPEDQGMLFVFGKEEDVSFWMKNMVIPLDIIWINEDREVVFIKKNAQPCLEDSCPSIDPGEKAKYVLEINAGLTDGIGLREGDSLQLILP